MNTIASIAVVVEPSPVIDVKSVGVQGPPGTPGAPGPAGPAGPQGPAGVAGPHQATHAVGGSDPVTGPLALSPYVSVGVNPSQSGAVRLANNSPITARNAANTADVALMQVDASNKVFVGQTTAATQVNGSDIVINTVAAAYTVDANGIYPNNDNARRIGYPTLRFSDANLYAISLKEKTAPAVPGANEANLWLEDNGAGKSRLMIQFATGAPIAIATQV